MVPLFLQGLFLPAALPKTFNQHTAAKLLPKRLSCLPASQGRLQQIHQWAQGSKDSNLHLKH